MDTPARKIQAHKAIMPPTPLSAKSRSSSRAKSSSAYATSSPPTLETPRARRSTSNRFWEKNETHSKENTHKTDLASETSDSDDNTVVADPKKLNRLDLKIKRLLVLETAGAVRIKSMETNEVVLAYAALLEAFAQKPKTKKKRTHDTNALLQFLQEHTQVLELYNQYAKVDQKLRKDRILPEFILGEEDEGDTAETGTASKDDANGIQRAPTKHALNVDDDSDVEGIVTQTIKPDQEFDDPSIFNTRGLTTPSIFNSKNSATAEKKQRRFMLHRRDGPLTKDGEGGDEDVGLLSWDDYGQEEEATPTRPGKRRKVA